MYRVLTCLAFEHDLRYVALAGLLCLLSSYVAVKISMRALKATGGSRLTWVTAAGVAGGFGIWSTHFVAMLAYDPGVVFGYDLTLTLVSLLIGIVATTAAIALGISASRITRVVVAGILFGGGITSMHYMGMEAVEFPGSFQWNSTLASASVVTAIVLSICGFFLLDSFRKMSHVVLASSILFTLAIVSMHFVAMGAVSVIPDITRAPATMSISAPVMAATIVITALAMLLTGLAATLFAVRAEIAAAAGEQRFRLLVQGVSDYAIYMLDPEGRVTNWNTGATRAKGYTESEIVGKHFGCFYSEEERQQGLPEINLERAEKTGKFEGEGWRYRKDGTKFWAHIVIDAIRNHDGSLVGFAKITRDRTEQMLADAKIKRAAEHLNLALNHMGNALCLFDSHKRLLMHNDRLKELLSIPASTDLHDKTFDEIIALTPANTTDGLAIINDLLHRNKGEITAELISNRHFRVTCSPAPSETTVLTLDDVTVKVNSDRRIAHMARHDALTGLANRGAMTDVIAASLEDAARTHKEVALIHIDLDGFKDINDTHGHGIGDQILRVIAQRLQSVLQDGEHVGRFGGDEFVALKMDSSDGELHSFIARVNSALTNEIVLDELTIKPLASLGVARFPADANDPDKLLANADMAMYRAKESFQDKVCFYNASMDEAERQKRALAKDIAPGIENNQFFLAYQVQREAVTHTIKGFEVLLRWKHPVHGLVPPNVFIPIAEESGGIGLLGDWVLEQACLEAATWEKPYRIAVNLSPLQLIGSDFVSKLHAVLIKSGLSPARLELEVTESAIIEDKQRALHILRQIRALGVTVALDDFGTGFSSLDTLRSFPFDKIKLDRSFVTDLERDRQARAFVRAVLALGKCLEIPVLAEGVETEAHVSILTEEGCNQFQGYYFGRPTSVDQILSMPKETKVA